MTLLIGLLTTFVAVSLLIQLGTCLVTARRCRPSPPLPPSGPLSPVTIIRPLCGIENFVAETLRSSFLLDYPHYELLFCVASASDPVLPLVERLIAAHPNVRARVLIGNDSISDNPKLNNCYKGWNAAAHDWIVFADSNVLMARDTLQRLLARWRADTGLVCSPPLAVRPDGFWAELECGFLNTYQARWQYAADSAGCGFAQGKTMLWRRELLDRAGGIRMLAAELAEDAAATKVVRGAGLRVHLVDAPLAQPLGARGLGEVIRRQLRWARLRRASFPFYFALEPLTGVLPPLAASALLVGIGAAPAVSMPAVLLAWYAAEAGLARSAGWPLSWRSPLAWMLRDLALPAVVLGGLGTEFVWRGNTMRTAESGSPA